VSDIPPEVLLGRLRQERLLREAELAALADALKDLKTDVKELSARTSAQIRGVTVDASALISTIEKVVTSPGFAMAERIDKLEAKIEDGEGNASASIVEIRRVIATSEYALAEIDQRLTAKIEGNAATVVTTLTAYATKTYAEARRDEAITAASADATAKVLVESTARSSADAANASSISTVSASVGSLSSTVTTNASASVTRDGFLSGKYSLKVAAGNVVTGMNISSTSGGGSDVSEIAFTGSVFKVYNGASNVVPFTVNTGTNTVTLTNVIVDTLAANISITSPTIVGGVLKLNGTATVCSNTADGSDTSLVRMNGGGASGATRGGQIDCYGDNYGFVSGTDYSGSVHIAPSSNASGIVRIYDNTGTIRFGVGPTGASVVGDFSASAISGTSYSGGAVTGTLITGQSSITSQGPVNAATFFSRGGTQVVGARGAAVTSADTTTVSTILSLGTFAGSDTISLSALISYLNALGGAFNGNAAKQNDLRDRIQTHGLIS
jgi:hypothetical protein